MQIIVDSHVHIYPSYDLAALMGCGYRNFASVASGMSENDWLGVLCLTERKQEDFYHRLSTGGAIGSWKVSESSGVLVVESAQGGRLLICPGFQVVTAERLEVLQLLTTDRCPDGLSLADTLLRGGGVKVLPWSPGKWLLKRGRLMTRLIETAENPGMLGDIWLRSAFWGEPQQFSAAKKRGWRVLPGSDPLNFKGEESRVGLYAAAFNWDLNWGDLSSSLTEMLRRGAYTVVGNRASCIEGLNTTVRQIMGRQRLG